MNALGGLDPKYIDEAAFELHEGGIQAGRMPGDRAETKKAGMSRIKKFVFVALPAAAVIVLSMTVTLPFLMRMNKSDSAAYDSAPAYEAEDAAADSAPASKEENMAEAYEEAAGSADAYIPEAAEDTEDFAAAAESEAESFPSIEKAVFKDGILTVEINGVLPENADETEYIITATDDSGPEETIAEGKLKDILKSEDPLTLDLSELALSRGTYVLTLGGESTEFTV